MFLEKLKENSFGTDGRKRQLKGQKIRRKSPSRKERFLGERMITTENFTRLRILLICLLSSPPTANFGNKFLEVRLQRDEEKLLLLPIEFCKKSEKAFRLLYESFCLQQCLKLGAINIQQIV